MGDITEAVGPALAQRIGKKRYDLWFLGNTRLTWNESQLVVGVPNLFYHDWLQKTYAGDLAAVAAELFGQAVDIQFAIQPDSFKTARKRQSDSPMPLFENPAAKPANGVPKNAPGSREAGPRSNRRERRFRRLDEFVVGPCNRVAHASALSLVEGAGDAPNPLVLHGPVGTGKTHLLEGIYSSLHRAEPEWRILFLSAEDFTNRFVQAMHHGKLAGFRKQFRECDALLIDDIHFLARKPATQEEFLHTFDTLHADQRPVVLTCDCHPRLSDQFGAELTDRLVGGAVWGLAPPDGDTRLQLLRMKSLLPDREPLSAEVLQFLASQLRGNIRELEGAVHSVYHFARAHGQKIDVALAKEALGDVVRHSVRLVQLADVENAVATVLGLEPKALQSRKRGWTVSHPRMLAMFLARKHTAATYAEIGHRFGGLNHSTAVAGEKKVRNWLTQKATLNLGRPILATDLVEKIEHELLR